ncbi:MAG: LamG-like jellyroll fold domain-containing protein [Elusimicrobiota bacterium]|nr:LamG-like jellyroll fold domain-containing protein [Elusimicrobiota bacterium]
MSQPALALAVLAGLLGASPARAATTFAPETLQCDGTYAAGSYTRHPAPLVRVSISDPVGLKIGQDRLGIVPASTRALWRFDSGITAAETCTVDALCPGGRCRRVHYDYADPNGTQTTRLGTCTYDSTTCADNLGLVAGQSLVPVSLGACPGAPASGSQSLFSASTLNAALFGNMGTFNGALSQVAVTNTQTVDWDLGATYTLTAWIRTAGAGVQRILSTERAGQSWGIALNGGQLRHFDSRDSAAGSTVTVNAGSGLNNGGWHLVHLVRRNGNDRRFYIDGRLVGTTVASSTNSFTSHPIASSAAVGGAATGGEHFTGDIDEVRVLTVALGDDDVMLEYNASFHKYSSNGGVSFSTVAGSYTPSTPPSRTQSAFTYVPGEAWTANSRWVFVAQSTFSVSSLGPTVTINRDTSAPTPPGSFAGTPTTVNDVTWSWTAPTTFCAPPAGAVSYTLVNPVTGLDVNPPGPLAHPTFSVGENFAGGPNQRQSRAVKTTDLWGTSVLSGAATVYTLAAVPTALSFSNVSSGSFTASWNVNGNPAYTRFEVSYSTDNFASPAVTTAVALGANFTGSSVSVSGLSAGATFYVRVRAYNGQAGDFFGGTPSAYLSSAVITRPPAPTLSATALSNSSVRFDWTAVPGATGYTLYGSGGAPVLYVGSELTFTSATLSANVSYGAEVEANTPSGPGARTSAFVFTHANAPITPSAPFVNSTSVTFAWNENGNPGYTFYELNLSTDAAFAVVIATVPSSSTSAAVTNLLPGTTYYARVRAISGSQANTAFLLFAGTVTRVNAGITQNATGGTPYSTGNGLRGQWHFDESTGTTAADGSGYGNSAQLTCVSAGCSSTPTFAGGPPGLGAAASVTGADHGLVRVPDSAAFNFGGDVTVVAWVNPATANQQHGAGIVVRGDGGAESWALDVAIDVVTRRFRFTPKPGTVVMSSVAIPAGAWTHLVGAYDATAGTASLYVNGRLSNTVAVVPPRNNVAHDVSIGNRQSAAAAYDRGFVGRIDGVRLFDRAFGAVEALAEYAGNSVSTVTASAPNDRVRVGLPPAAFGAAAVIYVSANPASSPIRITPAALDAGLTSLPSGLTLAPNTVVEIVPVVGGQPFTQNLGSSATVSIAYDDSNGDNLIDGTAPPLPASGLRMYTLNTTVNRWEELPTTLDPVERRAIGVTPHFSVFALFAPSTIGASLSAARAYPVPWKPGSGGRFDGPGIVFDRLPAAGRVEIHTLSGEKVADFAFSGASAGSVVWDGRNENGRRVASGVYYARITSDTDNARALLKLAIER